MKYTEATVQNKTMVYYTKTKELIFNLHLEYFFDLQATRNRKDKLHGFSRQDQCRSISHC